MNLGESIEGALDAYKSEVEEIAAQITLHWNALRQIMPPDEALPLLLGTAVLTAGVTSAKLALTIQACATETLLCGMGHHEVESEIGPLALACLEGIHRTLAQKFMDQASEDWPTGFEPPSSN